MNSVSDFQDVIEQRANTRRQKERWVALATVITPVIGTLATIILALNGVGGGAPEWILLGVMYVLSIIGVEVGYHRCFTHNAFIPNKPVTFLLAVFGTWTLEGPPMWWTAVHRRHHSNTDQNGDPHSPHGGVISPDMPFFKRFMHSHTLWLFNSDAIDSKYMATHAKDLYKNSVLFNINIHYWWWAMSGLILPTLILGLYYMSLQGALLGLLWGGLTRVFLGHHGFWSLNSLCHTYGSRPFETGDKSTNNAFVALVTLGQGWHNNHHAFPTSAKVGLRWWEFDPSWLLIVIMKRMGVISRVRVPSPEKVEARRKTQSI